MVILIGAIMGVCQVSAGPSPDPPSASSSSPVPTAAATPIVPATPSPDVLRRAKLAGYHLRKLRQGTTVFSKQEAHLGSRFTTDTCVDEIQLEEFLLRAQSQRDAINSRIGTGTNTK